MDVKNNNADLINDKVDWAGEPVSFNHLEMDNKFAQMVQDLLEMRS